MGIGPEGKRASLQLKYLAKEPRYSFAGDVSSLIQKASFTMFSGGLLKCKLSLQIIAKVASVIGVSLHELSLKN